MNARIAILAVCWSVPVLAVEPAQFAAGIELQAAVQRPVLELSLPDTVYAGVLRADLGDLRVFNAQGVAVPHALCTAPALLPVEAPGHEDRPLAVYALQAAASVSPPGSTEVQVRAEGGAQVSVRVGPGTVAPSGPRPAAAMRTSGYAIDARALTAPLRALRLDWETADGASELTVRVEASEDLDRWRSVVTRTTLLRVHGAGDPLERARIPLPEAPYRFLRLVRVGDGPQPGIATAIAETVLREAPAAVPYVWFDARAVATGDAGFEFDAGRRAPVQSARIELPVRNSAVRAALQSRERPDAGWQARWGGEVFALVDDGEARRSADPVFSTRADAHWRVQILQNAESLGSAAPRLRRAVAAAAAHRTRPPDRCRAARRGARARRRIRAPPGTAALAVAADSAVGRARRLRSQSSASIFPRKS